MMKLNRQPAVQRSHVMARTRFGCVVMCLIGMLLPDIACTPALAEDMTIYSAGTLRKALPELLEAFEVETGIHSTPLFGPSGLLRREIERGHVPDVFASAIAAHPEALQRAGIMKNSQIFARNTLCVIARPGIPLHETHMLETLLDPSLRLGTSTPEADALGDYTWAVFRKAEALRPGAFHILDSKALRLVGGEIAPSKRVSPAELLGDNGSADLFISYCTGTAATLKAVPGSTATALPEALTVPVELGIASRVHADQRAEQFIQFVVGDKGQDILARHGFLRRSDAAAR